MASPDRVEAVKKVTETLSKENIPDAGHFDSLMSSASGAQGVKPSSFERIDTKVYGADELQSVEPKPVFGEQNVTAQKNDSATDRDGRHNRQQTEEIEDVSGIGGRKGISKSESLLGEVSKINKNVANISNLSPENIKTQAKDVISQMENVKNQISSAKGEIKPSYQTLLRNRLSHIDDSLKIALNKAGVEYTPPSAAGAAVSQPNGVKGFLNMLTQSQDNLQNITSALDKIGGPGQISQANMLAIQIKMGYVQQQMELFTNVLNKALESTKTLMNVQV